ncbi:phosphoribosyl-ATP diphosphatase [Candidatus Nanosynsacchari sp. TM7_ANC_38.39_G1_1]|uniref:phosphoribosyl-ATP diphosphatase n=1 Tax=Candidatus Nanosynsacchari sp. TM7_ANC_38.39_G1_1 TaxID=1986206 RepID=UPI00101BE9A2|nr:phosphoribosyl-ATP diphosphatase [Candidatus Nanosynsacchari sp. TM7_ANC_38.39_G1_1]RYC73294.1 Phosphoribosyl-ATP pyrophosphatase [Candidatus Nanosynsacchari sp. TM7_ANC_38.39_G1_1]
MTIRELYEIIESRRNSDESTSYTRQLFDRGLDRIIQKVGEESVEVVIAAKNDENDEFIGEVADLVYHLLVLLVAKDIKITDIERCLQERHDNDNKLIK